MNATEKTHAEKLTPEAMRSGEYPPLYRGRPHLESCTVFAPRGKPFAGKCNCVLGQGKI